MDATVSSSLHPIPQPLAATDTSGVLGGGLDFVVVVDFLGVLLVWGFLGWFVGAVFLSLPNVIFRTTSTPS